MGREFATHKDYSEETAKNIDAEIVSVVTRNYERAKKILTDHIEILHKIAAELLEKEVLTGAEVDSLIGSFLPDMQLVDSKKIS